jgi:DNA-binding transcriptional MerR regulator
MHRKSIKMQIDDLYKEIAEVARIFKISHTMVYQYLKNGLIKDFRASENSN